MQLAKSGSVESQEPSYVVWAPRITMLGYHVFPALFHDGTLDWLASLALQPCESGAH
ncbi:hypothetical protein FPSE_04182 [Fusarium pseudograminearum CS3096]|uniref:Uncharacterized protein n=1 Tax=Fusarium pseudograminearum (strain CS3096) TaxID=1028729 RepID=K3UT54_FUSPC|nr:hypothetical protein FPSE_04182 [Fusarium pseudograminearum CS3096]EKJ75681.1 hypothetical protein FPSE_04182 [Fusarium pseudograminearum CS3096]